MKRIVFNQLRKYATGCAVVNEPLYHNFELREPLYNKKEATIEASRCFNCKDAQCMKYCPAQVNIPLFIDQISQKDLYGSAKTILSANPCGLSCGQICPTEFLCSGNCIQHNHPINIKGLQAFVINEFRKKATKKGYTQLVGEIEKPTKFDAPIALVGSGPASIACATGLARNGYTNITIFERQPFAGGLLKSELPEFRLPGEFVEFEVKLLEDLGVKFEFNQTLGVDFTAESLKADGYEAVFIGIGKPDPVEILKGDGILNSKNFLALVTEKSKAGIRVEEEYPEFHGHVVVLGAGDTAMDCVANAARLGADKVSVLLRRNFSSMRAGMEELLGIIEEVTCGCNFITNSVVKDVLRDEDGNIYALDLYRTVETELDDADMGRGLKKVVIDGEEQTFKLPCEHVITAMGVTLNEEAYIDGASPIEFDWGNALVARDTLVTPENEWLFAGGDVVAGGTAVEAIRDGKIAAKSIHEFLEGKQCDDFVIPEFLCELDA